jgi:hypothetical protein
MKMLPLAGLSAVAVLSCVASASAQDLRGFVGGGVMSDLNDERFPTVGGGVLVDLGQPWVSVGGQGEMFFSWPYVAGRGGMFAQANVVPKGPLRPFVLAGFGSGESAGTMLGTGVEYRPRRGGAGLRASVEDYLAKVGTQTDYYTDHQITVRVALTFR